MRTVLHKVWLTNFSLLFAADVSGVQKAAKSNEKLVNQKYASLFLSWMPFSWSGAEIKCTVHFVLPKRPVNTIKLDQCKTGPKTLLFWYIYCEEAYRLIFVPRYLFSKSTVESLKWRSWLPPNIRSVSHCVKR